MYTPKQLKHLESLLSKEAPELSISVRDYVQASVSEESFQLTEHLRVSAHGRIEVTPPNLPKPWANRLMTRSVVRSLVRCSRAGLPIGAFSKDWLSRVLRSDDYRREAEEVMRE